MQLLTIKLVHLDPSATINVKLNKCVGQVYFKGVHTHLHDLRTYLHVYIKGVHTHLHDSHTHL